MVSSMLCTADAEILAPAAIDTGVDHPELIEDHHENDKQKGQ